jgi:hypothetical protein
MRPQIPLLGLLVFSMTVLPGCVSFTQKDLEGTWSGTKGNGDRSLWTLSLIWDGRFQVEHWSNEIQTFDDRDPKTGLPVTVTRYEGKWSLDEGVISLVRDDGVRQRFRVKLALGHITHLEPEDRSSPQFLYDGPFSI